MQNVVLTKSLDLHEQPLHPGMVLNDNRSDNADDPPLHAKDNMSQMPPELLVDSPLDDSDNNMVPQELSNALPHTATPQV